MTAPLPAETSPDAAFTADFDRRFRAALVAYFLRRVGSQSEAEDLTQDVFLRLARNATHMRSPDAFVFTIAANLFRDRERTRAAHSASAHKSLDPLAIDSATAPGLVEDRDPERVLMAKESLKEVMAALDELSERTREIFVLSRLEHTPQRDIAAMYGISVGAVEKHVLKAVAHIGARFYK